MQHRILPLAVAERIGFGDLSERSQVARILADSTFAIAMISGSAAMRKNRGPLDAERLLPERRDIEVVQRRPTMNRSSRAASRDTISVPSRMTRYRSGSAARESGTTSMRGTRSVRSSRSATRPTMASAAAGDPVDSTARSTSLRGPAAPWAAEPNR
jgi:hypothetical protein